MDSEALLQKMSASLWSSLDNRIQEKERAPEVNEVLRVEKLSDARKLRKQAELDVQALENRILLLEKEEERARQRIELTRKRAEEIKAMREQNLQKKKSLQKLAQKAKEPQKSPKKRLKSKSLRASSRESKKTSRVEIEQIKRKEADKCREAKKKQSETLTKRRKDNQRAAKQKMLAIKKQREELQRRQLIEREKIRLRSQREYQQRIFDEKRIALKFETKAQALERKEIEIIQRLKDTQERQREAYKKLEKVMIMP